MSNWQIIKPSGTIVSLNKLEELDTDVTPAENIGGGQTVPGYGDTEDLSEYDLGYDIRFIDGIRQINLDGIWVDITDIKPPFSNDKGHAGTYSGLVQMSHGTVYNLQELAEDMYSKSPDSLRENIEPIGFYHSLTDYFMDINNHPELFNNNNPAGFDFNQRRPEASTCETVGFANFGKPIFGWCCQGLIECRYIDYKKEWRPHESGIPFPW